MTPMHKIEWHITLWWGSSLHLETLCWRVETITWTRTYASFFWQRRFDCSILSMLSFNNMACQYNLGLHHQHIWHEVTELASRFISWAPSHNDDRICCKGEYPYSSAYNHWRGFTNMALRLHGLGEKMSLKVYEDIVFHLSYEYSYRIVIFPSG